MLRLVVFQQSRIWRQLRRCSSSSQSPIPKPKPPPGVFGLFLEDNCDQFRSSNVYVNESELIRLVGDAWKELPQDERQNYREKYVELVDRYKDNLIAFEDQLDDDQRIVRALKESNQHAQLETERASKLRPIEFPKRHATAFGQFIVAAREAFPREPSQTVTEWNDTMAQKWRDMNEEEKKKFRQASQETDKQFAVEKEDKQTFSLDEVGGFQR